MFKQKNKKRDNNLKKQITAGVLLIIVGTSLLINNYIKDKRDEVFSAMNIDITEELNKINESIKENDNINETVEPVEETHEEEIIEEDTNDDYESYLGILEINKINFYKGFYDKGSSLNNVKFNIKFLEVSSYPDEPKGNVIIVGHAGNYNNSYFKDLYQLNLGDTASIYYNNKKYTYKIVNIYNEYKDGTVTIYRDTTKDCLTLITCTKDDNEHQTLYIFERLE